MLKMIGKLRELDTKVKLMKLIYMVFGPFALALGLWIAIAPNYFWELLRVTEDNADPVVQTIYGAVLCGVGILCLLGARRPLQYSLVLLFLAVYKGITFLALISHLSYMVVSGQGAPIAGWFIAVIWLFLSLACGLAYPWGKHVEAVDRMKNE